MIIKIKLHPSSSQEKINKISEGEYEIWLKSKPIDNKANIELCKVLKKHFNAKQVNIKSGFTSKIKRVEVYYN